MSDERIAEHVALCWKQMHGLAHAIETRTREAYRPFLLTGDSDERLADLETKALGLAQAIHEVRLLRRFA